MTGGVGAEWIWSHHKRMFWITPNLALGKKERRGGKKKRKKGKKTNNKNFLFKINHDIMIIRLFLKGKEEIESSKVSDPVVVWLMSKNAFDIFSRFLLSEVDCLGGLDLLKCYIVLSSFIFRKKSLELWVIIAFNCRVPLLSHVKLSFLSYSSLLGGFIFLVP